MVVQPARGERVSQGTNLQTKDEYTRHDVPAIWVGHGMILIARPRAPRAGCTHADTARGFAVPASARSAGMGRPPGSKNKVPSHPARFYSKIRKTSGCWLWRGGKDRCGYGLYSVGTKRFMAHRMAYELMVGPIPEGMQIDHVKARGCTNRHCVNPAHLEVVTLQENVRRGDAPCAIHARQTHCKHGHPFDEANTYRTPDGRRKCRACHRARTRLVYRRQPPTSEAA